MGALTHKMLPNKKPKQYPPPPNTHTQNPTQQNNKNNTHKTTKPTTTKNRYSKQFLKRVKMSFYYCKTRVSLPPSRGKWDTAAGPCPGILMSALQWPAMALSHTQVTVFK